MKPILLASLSLVLSSVALAQPDLNKQGMAANPPEAQVEPLVLKLDTPVDSTRHFMKALSNSSEFDLSQSVAGARAGFFGADEWEEIRRDVYPFNMFKNLRVDNVDVDKQTDDTATVKVAVHYEFPGAAERRDPGTKFTLQLRREANPLGGLGTIWRVVPLSIEEVLAKPLYQQPPFPLAAALSLRDPRLLPFLRQQQAMSQLKQLGLGALQFVQDYDEVYALDDMAHERAVLPYLKNKSVYTIAGTKDEKWHFNDNLSAKQLAELQEPARTVLFYDGSAPDTEQLNFRFDNKTLICFADGHVAGFTKDELKSIIWKP